MNWLESVGGEKKKKVLPFVVVFFFFFIGYDMSSVRLVRRYY